MCCYCAGKCEGDGKFGDSCEGYEPVLNSRGQDVVIGTAVFEGYLAGRAHTSIGQLHAVVDACAAVIPHRSCKQLWQASQSWKSSLPASDVV